MDHKSIVNRIQKLLRLSASNNEHEAAAAAAKAQALLSQYNLAMSDIPDQEQCQKAEEARARTRQALEEWAFDLARATAVAFDCRYYHRANGYTVFVGVGADQEVCAWTYHYLYKTLLRMGSTYLREKCRRLRTNRSRNAARASYLRGLVYTVRGRLEAQKAKTPITESALVPVKNQAIDAAMPENLRTREFKRRSVRENDFMNGMSDGRKIPLSSPLDSSHRQKIA